MSSWRVFLAAFLAVTPLLVVSATPAHACRCRGSVEENVAAAEIIAVGAVREIRAIEPLLTEPIQRTGIEVVISIEEYIKGSGSGTEVATQLAFVQRLGPSGELEPIGVSTCDTFGSLGGRYVLLLRRGEDDLLHAGPCNGSRSITVGGEEAAGEYVEQIRLILEQPAPEIELPDTGTGGASAEPSRSSRTFEVLQGAAFSGTTLQAAGALGALLAAGALLVARRPAE